MVTNRKEEGTEAEELVVVTQSYTGGAESIPSVAVVTAEPVPVTMADGLSGDLDAMMPLMIPESNPQEVVMESPPSDAQEAEGGPGLAETPTPASSDHSLLLTPLPVDEPADADLEQELTPTSSIATPTQDSEAGSVEVLLWPKEADVHSKDAVQSENDTATFSAATVLSGDGEVDHAPSSSYAHLLDADSQMDYQYGPGDAFLPVSSAAAFRLLFLLLLLLLHPPIAPSF